MSNYTLIYFSGCPNHLPAVELLEKANLKFETICQDELGKNCPEKNYTSPTLLYNEKIIFGSKAIGGGCSMPLPDLEGLLKLLV